MEFWNWTICCPMSCSNGRKHMRTSDNRRSHATLKCYWKRKHYKLYGSRLDNNNPVKFVFHRFVWNRHEYHSSTCIVWTLMLCALFWHECHILVHIV
jgi:hypothetical protein